MTPSSWTKRRCAECKAPAAVRRDGWDLCGDHFLGRRMPSWWYGALALERSFARAGMVTFGRGPSE